MQISIIMSGGCDDWQLICVDFEDLNDKLDTYTLKATPLALPSYYPIKTMRTNFFLKVIWGKSINMHSWY